jgi:hypothetical protein
MSPAGVPMFYAARDELTTLMETPLSGDDEGLMVTLATFETLVEMPVLDLTRLPEVPSLFDENRRHLRDEPIFLHHLTRDISTPIEKDGMEHIEYRPTQVVTEYFRRVFKTKAGRSIMGILYPSSKWKKGKCVVLFVEQKDCCDSKPAVDAPAKPFLALVADLTKRVSVNQAQSRIEFERRFDFDSM